MKNNINNSLKESTYKLNLNEYKEGFSTILKTDELEKGINEKVICAISRKRNEPDWMLNFRMQAYNAWLNMSEPHWLHGKFDPINYNEYSYYSAPKCDSCQNDKRNKTKKNSQNYLIPEVKNTFKKLGIPTKEDKNIAIDAIFDSVSVSTTYQSSLKEMGIIFCSFSEAIQNYPELVRKYLGSVVPANDNFFAALNSAVASDGTFVYIPKNVQCPMELSTYFRINSANTGQFERTILIADKNSTVSYIEGCSAPIRDGHQLHAAVVEVIVLDYATVKYSTVQNWFPGQSNESGILNFVTKRALCKGKKSKMSWTQSETGSAITWKYPSVILKGNESIGEFFSIALTKNYQQADTGTKMIHIGKNSSSTIVSKTISSGQSNNTYRGLVKITSQANYSRNFTQCDSMLIGTKSGAHTFPNIQVNNQTSQIEHEATTSKIEEDQIFYCQQRGINVNDAISMIVHGFCKEVFSKLPLEFAIEAEKLLHINLDHSIG
ncbi:component of SufBCD complex [Wigglesworthia glossinidia endosymbiont of Glossina morsitans morsitans (Yale colony)]|uniref:Component of SufBCD complex n=1 Tax=Wigglesworthia glossinidia endosymbiont of Glossina morsitans morsitans (Yale colony) TaxID=1142511 RepID=H6Q4V6_WIGGL|nr:Fe-S cluster assembly protein SufB [Wigglesworthia glossinidia]AFA41239.1 component of SufBCD complex [Wigglesworthia glossinidia endosymbiont of Glossina morsitans morsitans (Yale colony)]